MTDEERVARELLHELEERLAAKDLATITDLFTDDPVLLGDGEESFGHEAVTGYLNEMVEMEPDVRWEWERVVATRNAPHVLTLSAVGIMGFYDPAGQLVGDTERFRTSIVAVEQDGRWRIQHFHGSEPQGG